MAGTGPVVISGTAKIGAYSFQKKTIAEIDGAKIAKKDYDRLLKANKVGAKIYTDVAIANVVEDLNSPILSQSSSSSQENYFSNITLESLNAVGIASDKVHKFEIGLYIEYEFKGSKSSITDIKTIYLTTLGKSQYESGLVLTLLGGYLKIHVTCSYNGPNNTINVHAEFSTLPPSYLAGTNNFLDSVDGSILTVQYLGSSDGAIPEHTPES